MATSWLSLGLRARLLPPLPGWSPSLPGVATEHRRQRRAPARRAARPRRTPHRTPRRPRRPRRGPPRAEEGAPPWNAPAETSRRRPVP